MSFMYSKIERKKNYLLQGLLFGALIGLLWVFPHELVDAGAHGESISDVIKNSLWHLVEQGFGGFLIALIFNKRKEELIKTKKN